MSTVLLLTPASVEAQAPGALPESSGPVIPYASPSAAIAALRLKPGIRITNQQGWVIAEDPSDQSLWSFPPPGHPAYPAAVQRKVVIAGNKFSIAMAVLCGGSKLACDNLVRSFTMLDDQLRELAERLPGYVPGSAPN